MLIQLLFLNSLKISKISLFWTFSKKNWLCLASCALFILKLYKAFQTTVQIAMTVTVKIKFRSKFLFEIPLQFYWTVEKVETCDGNSQKLWQVPPSFQPSHFGYYLFFHDWDLSILNIKVLYLTNKIFTRKDIEQ